MIALLRITALATAVDTGFVSTARETLRIYQEEELTKLSERPDSDTHHTLGGVNGHYLHTFLSYAADLVVGTDNFPTPNSSWPNDPVFCP